MSHHLTQSYSVQFQLKIAFVASHCLIITTRIKPKPVGPLNSAWRDGSLQGSCLPLNTVGLDCFFIAVIVSLSPFFHSEILSLIIKSKFNTLQMVIVGK